MADRRRRVGVGAGAEGDAARKAVRERREGGCGSGASPRGRRTAAKSRGRGTCRRRSEGHGGGCLGLPVLRPVAFVAVGGPAPRWAAGAAVTAEAL